MLSTGVMVMTTMATVCVLSFLEVDGEVVVVAVVVDQWDNRGRDMAPHPDAQSTGFLCQVGDVFLPLQVVLIALP